MTVRDEICAALNGEKVDMAPPAVFTQTGTVEQMDSCGAFWPDANFNADMMAKLSLQFSRQYGFATAKVPFCLTVETERLGCEINPGTKCMQPSTVDSPYRGRGYIPDVPDLLSPEEFVSGGRCPLVVESAEKVSKENPDLFMVTGLIDPFIAAYQTVGVEDFLMGLMMEPEKAEAWVQSLSPLFAEYAKVLSEVSDDVQIISDASSDLLPPDNFDNMIRQPVSKMISNIKCFSTLHCCGDTSEVLENLASLGEDGLSLETDRDPQGIFDLIGKKVNLIGGIPAISMLLQGSPEDIRSSARKYSDIGYSIISPECGVPPQTPGINLQALANYRN